ncbi:MAG: alkaline phosphatase [Anaerolineales bacterium]
MIEPLRTIVHTIILLPMIISSSSLRTPPKAQPPKAQHIILLIGDGMGANQFLAAQRYSGHTPFDASWFSSWISTYPYSGDYDPSLAWSDPAYLTSTATDSAAAATALYSGVKTSNGRINTTDDLAPRLDTISDLARQQGLAVGAVSSVYISHATPGAWIAHNDSRSNGFAIADEGLWGDPTTTGTISDTYHSGGHGLSSPAAEVVIGAGHPDWKGGSYVSQAIRDKLAMESGLPGALRFVERQAGSPDGGVRLLNAAGGPDVQRLAGLFGGSGGNLDYRLADGSGYDPENPRLAEMTQAALSVLNRDPDGFVLMIEGGAIDWASHANQMDAMIGETLDFFDAIQAVEDWVADPGNGSDWSDSLVIVTADHETGFLTAAPDRFGDAALGEISARTLTLEKTVSSTGRRASWEDADRDALIDPGERVYWSWNSSGHTNSLVPLYARGAGASLFNDYATNSDPVRGAYLDNSNVFEVMQAVLPAGNARLVYHQQTDAFVNGVDGSRYLQTGSGASVTVSFKVNRAGATNQARLYYTTDGSRPEGIKGAPKGTTQTLTCTYGTSFGNPPQDVITCPPIPTDSAWVAYTLSAWDENGGEEVFANSRACHQASCANVFYVQNDVRSAGARAINLFGLSRLPGLWGLLLVALPVAYGGLRRHLNH